MYQIFGSVSGRCISFESSGLPLAVCVPAMTQLFDPGVQLAQAGNPSAARSAVRSSPGARLAWERSSSSSSLPGFAAGAGCGWLRSSRTPVGGWSRQEPTG